MSVTNLAGKICLEHVVGERVEWRGLAVSFPVSFPHLSMSSNRRHTLLISSWCKINIRDNSIAPTPLAFLLYTYTFLRLQTVTLRSSNPPVTAAPPFYITTTTTTITTTAATTTTSSHKLLHKSSSRQDTAKVNRQPPPCASRLLITCGVASLQDPLPLSPATSAPRPSPLTQPRATHPSL
ncbi:hypothetical protein E2C01_033831 [Portunus trituberculatus]|uniref:Uncharacterized protein n=1 Tax=Portunus trituberculatus TaxID=210409 RepID=A0A5B7F3S1_PORTR|nr:hypothetical protein [Portunus trituberculatus]